MSLWSELKVVKAATISIYPTVSEDFAEAGGGLAASSGVAHQVV
jgi:hypothetical protein